MTAPTTTSPEQHPQQHAPTNGHQRARIAPATLPFDNPEYVALVKRRCAPTAKPDEFAEFIYTAERLQLDPLARQIYFIRRGAGGDDSDTGRAGAEVSIDGARLLAERTGDYCGQTPPEWAKVYTNAGDATIVWYPVWPFRSEQPHACRIGVYRRGFTEPLVAVGRFDAYAQHKRGGGLNSMWTKRGPEQLAKCTEALALRQAFPKEMSGVYTDDEMGQADNEPTSAPSTTVARTATRRNTGTASPTKRETPRAAAAPTEPAAVAPVAAPAVELHEFAIPESDRREAREAGVAWYPFAPFAYVPLNALWPAGREHAGQYVIGNELLDEAERRLSAAHERATKAGDEKRAAQLTHSLNWLAAEMARRADAITEAASNARPDGP